MKTCWKLVVLISVVPFFVYATSQSYFKSDSDSDSSRILLDDSRLWQQTVRYQIEASLDTTRQVVEGIVFISYTNNSPDTLQRIYLQVPANAFTDEDNTAMKEMQRFQRPTARFRRRKEPPLAITGLQFHSIGDATDFSLRAYKFGDTILDWPLPLPLLPGDSLTMSVGFTVDCRELFKNARARDRQLDFVLWFPRLCVYDQRGWHPEPFHFMMSAQSVFAEFADFDVTLIVPGDYVVVGSGEVISGDAGWEAVTINSSIDSLRFSAWRDSVRRHLWESGRRLGARRVRFRSARPSQNFIWSVSPAFVRMAGGTGKAVDFFFRDLTGKRWAEKINKEIAGVENYLHDQIGALPDRRLVFVRITHPNRTGQPPMTLLNDDDAFDVAYAVSEMYFPGAAGVNGVKEGWLAYGLAVYFAKAYSEKRFGKMGYDVTAARKALGALGKLYSLPAFDEVMRNLTQLYMNSGQNESIAKGVHEYKDPLSMVANSFVKSSVVFEMLRFVVGDSAFREIVHDFYQNSMFRYVGVEAFIVASEKHGGQDLDWFFEQWLHRTPTIDYQQGEINKQQAADGTWRTEVEIKRQGDGVMPVDVQVNLGDGQTLTKRWDGKAKSDTIVFETAQKPGAVLVDPNNRILDNNPLNNRRLRLEFKPDLPFMRFLHMPSDAVVVLWRPTLGYNDLDGLRLGLRTRSSYRAFYHNLTLQLDYAVNSQTLDGMIAYNHPLAPTNVANRFGLMARKAEGRFETGAHFEWRASRGMVSAHGGKLEIGLNYSELLNSAYTFREMENDTGTAHFDEWDDQKIFAGYVEASGQIGGYRYEGQAALRLEVALPPGDRQFAKISARSEVSRRFAGLVWRGCVNLATAIGKDVLPLQDKFHAEGAEPRARFRNNLLKTGGDWTASTRLFVDGGGYLRGYAGTPLPVERYATANLEIGPSFNLAGFSFFGFYDRGALWVNRHGRAKTLSDAGAAISFGGARSRFLGGSALSTFSMRFYVPFYLSDPLPGEKKTQWRYYFAISKSF
jgi:hypothetical protein